MANDPTGTQVGRLSVLGLERVDVDSHSYYLCRCLCGNYSLVRGTRLTQKKTKSCGCLRTTPRSK